MFDVAIIIVIYRSVGLGINCLSSIFENITDNKLNIKIVVVNSGADKHVTAKLNKKFPDLEIIEKSNSGYSSAVNAGIVAVNAEYYFILNPDILFLQKNIIPRLLEFMQKNPNIGMCAPKLLNPDGKIQQSTRRFPPFFEPLYSRTFFGRYGFAKKAMRSFLMVDWDHNSVRDVDWILGSAMFVRAKAIKEVGLLDEKKYFMYVEDTDWCRSFWMHNWRVTYLNDLELVHYHLRSSAESRGIAGIFNNLARAHVYSWFRYFIKFYHQQNPHQLYDKKNTRDST